MPLRHIQSPQNPTIKSVAKLRTSRGRRQQHRIVIDGTREVQRAIDCGIKIESVFVLERSDVEPSGGQIRLLDSWAEACDVIYVAPPAFAKIAFGNRSEVVAIAETPSRSLANLQLPNPATIAVLERMEKPGNVGAIMRSADGAGIDAVVVVDLRTDLFNPNAIRASLGTIFSLQVADTAFDEFADWIRRHDFHLCLAKCDDDAIAFDDATAQASLGEKSVAIVLGNEADGLSERWDRLGRAINLHIPMRGIADSLNVSVSAAVFFYQIVKTGKRG